MNRRSGHPKEIPGALYAAAAYMIWGFLPLYWKALHQVPAREILAHRILWSFLFVTLLLLVQGRLNELRALLVQGRKMRAVFAGAVVISLNWFVYIWAVNSGRVVETSLGYFINPLVNVALGILFLKERLDFWQSVSLALATLGVGIITFEYGSMPWVALSVAISFGLYGLAKKVANTGPLESLAIETAFMLPAALIYIFLVHSGGSGAFGTGSLRTSVLLCGAGIVSAIPMLLFAQGARRVTMATLGFVQYLSPTISLILGVFVFREDFTPVHMISFSFIWLALLIYALSRMGLLDRFQTASRERDNQES